MIAAALLLAAVPAGADPVPGTDGESVIVVTADRLERVRIDYRLRGRNLAYCGARRGEQDLAAVSDLCGLVAECVAAGHWRTGLAACVDRRVDERRAAYFDKE